MKLRVGNSLCEVVIISFPMPLGSLKSVILCSHPLMENEWATADKHCFYFLSFFFSADNIHIFLPVLHAITLTIVMMGTMNGLTEIHSHNHRWAIMKLLFIDQERTLNPHIMSSTF